MVAVTQVRAYRVTYTFKVRRLFRSALHGLSETCNVVAQDKPTLDLVPQAGMVCHVSTFSILQNGEKDYKGAYIEDSTAFSSSTEGLEPGPNGDG